MSPWYEPILQTRKSWVDWNAYGYQRTPSARCLPLGSSKLTQSLFVGDSRIQILPPNSSWKDAFDAALEDALDRVTMCHKLDSKRLVSCWVACNMTNKESLVLTTCPFSPFSRREQLNIPDKQAASPLDDILFISSPAAKSWGSFGPVCKNSADSVRFLLGELSQVILFVIRVRRAAPGSGLHSKRWGGRDRGQLSETARSKTMPENPMYRPLPGSFCKPQTHPTEKSSSLNQIFIGSYLTSFVSD